MSLSKKYSRLFDKYDKRYVLLAEELDNCYIFDLSEGGRLVGSRALNGKPCLISTIFDIMSEAEADFVASHCKSYTTSSAAVSTRLGIAILYPHFTPAGSLCMLIYPTVGGNEFYKALSLTGHSPVLSPEAQFNLKKKKILKDDCVRDSGILMERIDTICEGMVYKPWPVGNITDTVAERVYDIACYVGCPVGVVCGEPLISVGDFDFPLFTCMTMLLLLGVRNISTGRTVSVAIEHAQYGGTITVSFETGGRNVKELDEVLACRRLTDRKNMLFEIMASDKIAHVRFSPVSHDWSYLELKSPRDSEEQQS